MSLTDKELAEQATEEEITEEEVPEVVPDYVEVHASELRKIGNAVRAGERYMKALNEMNAALHLEDPVYSPLTTNLSNAAARVEAILEGHNARLKERDEDDGTDEEGTG